MTKQTRGLLLIGVAAIATSLAAVGYLALQKDTEATVHSCVVSIFSSILKDQITESEVGVMGNYDWYVLNAAEVDPIISRRHPGDCGGQKWSNWGERARKPGESLLDAWGERFQIAVRRNPLKAKSLPNDWEFMVWSKGPDRISRTTDDIIVPHEEKAPIE